VLTNCSDEPTTISRWSMTSFMYTLLSSEKYPGVACAWPALTAIAVAALAATVGLFAAVGVLLPLPLLPGLGVRLLGGHSPSSGMSVGGISAPAPEPGIATFGTDTGMPPMPPMRPPAVPAPAGATPGIAKPGTAALPPCSPWMLGMPCGPAARCGEMPCDGPRPMLDCGWPGDAPIADMLAAVAFELVRCLRGRVSSPAAAERAVSWSRMM
jgi:hypothetical protein